ncbi:MAG: TIGR02302 family protein, partial [Bradyrhizobium sp.]
VLTALDGLLIAPQLFMRGKAGEYLGLRNVADELEAAHTDDALRQVVASLWGLAVSIEDGNLTDVDKALRAAQDALKQALDRGASDQEIEKLTQNLQAALDKYMQELAKRFRNNPLAMARPPGSHTKILRRQDLDDMIERMERLSRSGDKEGAKRLLERLEETLENLQMARPGQSGHSGSEQALNKLGDMIRKQQQLRDRTFKQGQESRRNPLRGKQGNDRGMGQLQQDQEGLRDQLRKLQGELARRGIVPSQGGEQGQQGKQGRGGEGLGEAGKDMGDASGQLGQGNADAAVDSQGRALEALRKGAQSLADAMQKGNGQGNGAGGRMGWQQGGDLTDPLGRPSRGHNFADDSSKMVPNQIDAQRARKILQELRRRLSDRSRPQAELDYIKRLLKGD